ncbi:coiled-coil alpha-helical rod protein 1 [Fukomys damarensis]|uniref:coiled-coil alpha-helical rod protein 1 n=1 Tax=Fukomys damarensis TaxID=885580 RepID=UPI00053F5169|nr:coiled-coil alpha-helical rod protein 1 [Fukomys damarensis]
MAWWRPAGLPPALPEPWRELWRLGSGALRWGPSLCPPARSPGDPRNRRSRGNIDGRRQNPGLPNTGEMLPPSGFSGLVPPSHFQARPFPLQPRVAPTWGSDVPLTQPPAHQVVSERQQRPLVAPWEQDVSGDCRGPGRRGRSLELVGSQALSEQAELISRQLQELRRLEEEVRGLRETLLQQKMRLEAQAVELEALAWAEKASQVEAEGLRAALAGAEVVRKNLEEGSQRELEEVQRLHQEQLCCLTQAHQEALAGLTGRAEGLEKSLSGMEARRAEEAKELAAARSEADLLRRQLSKTQEDLEAQVALVENLRKYVGEQVPPEAGSQAWEPQRQALLDAVQHLQEDRASLRATAELLQVRVQSLTCVLALQEEELTRKLPPSDSLEPECVKKHQSLLSRWREKVFALLVQLRSQELEHRDSQKALQGRVAELQEQVTAQSQERAILHRCLQDRAAEVDVERMGAKVGAEGARLESSALPRPCGILLGSALAPCYVGALPVRAGALGFSSVFPSLPPSLSVSLSCSLAPRRVAELGTNLLPPLLLPVLAPAPPPAFLTCAQHRMDDVVRLRPTGPLRVAEGGGSVTCALSSCQIGLQSTTAKLEQAAARLPGLSNRLSYAVRKVHTIQGLMARKLALAQLRLERSAEGRRLKEARREQAKAVVSLRQIQRSAAREKERNQELRRLQEEARKEEGQRLSRRLQELERDKNLMLATLQQEGLLSHYKQQRLLAVLPSLLDEEKSAKSSSRPPGSEAPVLPAPSTGNPRRGSLSVLLGNLQGLSEAIAKEEAVCQGDSQGSPAPVHS